MIDDGGPIMRWLWPLLAAMAGGVTALSFQPWKNMSLWQIVMALAVATGFAMFVGPLVAQWVLGAQSREIRWLGAIMWIMASGSNILIPLVIKRIGNNLGDSNVETGK